MVEISHCTTKTIEKIARGLTKKMNAAAGIILYTPARALC